VSTVEATGPEPDFWSIHDIQFHCRIGRTRAWQLVHESAFPAPVAIGARRIWPRLEVLAYLHGCRKPPETQAPRADAAHTPYVVRRVRTRP
jgi:predicted DNA-binding transcriptional regulator AlpA